MTYLFAIRSSILQSIDEQNLGFRIGLVELFIARFGPLGQTLRRSFAA